MKHGFVYIWFDKKRRMFYLGCHWGYEDDGYICSSRRMKDAYKRRPSDFKRRVLERVHTGRKELLEAEYKWLRLIDKEELGGRKYYNVNNHHFGHWSASDKPVCRARSEETKRRMSEAQKGRVFSEEHKAKIRAARVKQVMTEETARKIGESNRGQKRSKEFSAKLSEIGKSRDKAKLFGGRPNTDGSGMKGKRHSEETKRLMSEKAAQIVKCPHCNKQGAAGPMRVWHFDNCKQKKQQGVTYGFQHQ